VRAPVVLAMTAFVLAEPGRASACPIGTSVVVDNDTPGSGYSEEKPENWVSHNVDACADTYRYLSHTVGDGTRTGKAIWKPQVPATGNYQVVTSFRATVNRTDDADYVLHDDLGGQQKQSVNQKFEGGCTKLTIGNVYCVVGGACRLELDGTDDGQSDSADVTTFTLVSCDAPDAAAPSPCDSIASHPGWEVCEQSATTCAGVFTDGAGCAAFCAAAGMQCVARFGGEPGCAKEPNNPLSCDDASGHGSDYCECELPAPPDAGPDAASGVGGGAGMDAGSGGTSGWPAADGSAATGGAALESDAEDGGGCGCRSAPGSRSGSAFALAALLALALRRRR
jgi:MYXO-CTERM domain-containing protein